MSWIVRTPTVTWPFFLQRWLDTFYSASDLFHQGELNASDHWWTTDFSHQPYHQPYYVTSAVRLWATPAPAFSRLPCSLCRAAAVLTGGEHRSCNSRNLIWRNPAAPALRSFFFPIPRLFGNIIHCTVSDLWCFKEGDRCMFMGSEVEWMTERLGLIVWHEVTCK